jgi:hypothetical protein
MVLASDFGATAVITSVAAFVAVLPSLDFHGGEFA